LSLSDLKNLENKLQAKREKNYSESHKLLKATSVVIWNAKGELCRKLCRLHVDFEILKNFQTS